MIIDENNNPVERVMENAYNGLKNIIGSDMILGSPVITNEGVSIIPVSRITFGLLTGGGEYGVTGMKGDFPFAGGSGSGMSVTPMAFLVCDGTKVKIINMDERSAVEYFADMIPDLLKGLTERNENKKK